MNSMKDFLVKMGERALKTAGQIGATIFIADKFDWTTIGFEKSLKMIGIAVICSICTSLASINIGPNNDPSVI